jgi:hypothetical protein
VTKACRSEVFSLAWYLARCDEGECALSDITEEKLRVAVLATCAKRHGHPAVGGYSLAKALLNSCPRNMPAVPIEAVALPELDIGFPD